MVRRFRVSSVAIVTLFFLLSEAYSAGTKRRQSPFERLVEIKTVDENGRVTARMVAESSTEGRVQSRSNTDYEETSDTDEQGDDEDGRAVSSGSSERNGEEDGDFSIAHDEPAVSSGNGSYSPADQDDYNITKKPVTPSGGSNESNPVTTTTTTTTLPPSVATFPSNTSTIILTTPENTTTAAPTASDPVTTTPNTTTPNYTTPNSTVTVSPSTTFATTRPSMTSVTETGTQTTTINYPTTKPGNATNNTVNTDKPMDLSTDKISTQILYSGPVRANRDPTERRRKTLFGFVTIEILIALLAGALFSILLVAFLVYRLKKRNEGSYELSETIALRPKELDEMGKKKEVFV